MTKPYQLQVCFQRETEKIELRFIVPEKEKEKYIFGRNVTFFEVPIEGMIEVVHFINFK